MYPVTIRNAIKNNLEEKIMDQVTLLQNIFTGILQISKELNLGDF
ncbi:hypothetical protein GM3709_2472 [Geminocystis sp. NIES-3709]|nr:hypothetical protein GM3709_2472 [Geminocystis sp. NIES-3709]